MNALIESLKAQHVAVQAIVLRMNAAIERGDLASVQRELTSLKTGLLAHLAQEDAELYPSLDKAIGQRSNQNLTVLVRSFSTNIGQISEALSRFLEKYEGKTLPLDLFSKEWTHISRVLASRIRSEEETLYPLFQKLVEGDNKARPVTLPDQLARVVR